MELRVNKLEADVADIKSEVVDLKTRLAVAESNIKDIKEDLSSIKNNTTWIIRLIIGTIVGGIVTFGTAVFGFISSQGGF